MKHKKLTFLTKGDERGEDLLPSRKTKTSPLKSRESIPSSIPKKEQ